MHWGRLLNINCWKYSPVWVVRQRWNTVSLVGCVSHCWKKFCPAGLTSHFSGASEQKRKSAARKFKWNTERDQNGERPNSRAGGGLRNILFSPQCKNNCKDEKITVKFDSLRNMRKNWLDKAFSNCGGMTVPMKRHIYTIWVASMEMIRGLVEAERSQTQITYHSGPCLIQVVFFQLIPSIFAVFLFSWFLLIERFSSCPVLFVLWTQETFLEIYAFKLSRFWLARNRIRQVYTTVHHCTRTPAFRGRGNMSSS